jgi:tetratricopeptide (TPR) repeat protein
VLYELDDLEGADQTFRLTLEQMRQSLGRKHSQTLLCLGNYASIVERRGKLEEAESLYREAVEGMIQIRGPDNNETLDIQSNLGLLLFARGNQKEAESLLANVIERRRRVFGDHDLGTVISVNNLAGCLRDAGRTDEAHGLYEQALVWARQGLPSRHFILGRLLTAHGRNLLLLNRFPDAEAVLLEAHGILHESLGDTHTYTSDAVQRLVEVYEAWEKSQPGIGHSAQANECRNRSPRHAAILCAQGRSRPMFMSFTRNGSTGVPSRDGTRDRSQGD